MLTQAAYLSLAVAGLTFVPSTSHADCLDGRPINIGHRGTGNSSMDNPLPENTIPSLLAAVDEGSTMIEIDVQLSADMVPVLLHDPTVEGTTDGMGCVSELTVEELQQLDAGAGTPMEGTGIQVPTLEEVLQQVDVDLNVELKLSGGECPTVPDPEFVSAVLDVLDADPTDRQLLLSSFDFPLLEEVRAQDASVPVGQIAISVASAPATADANFDALVLTEGSTDEAALMTVRDLGLELYVWTVDAPERLSELIALDVDGIITNEPPDLEEARAQACPTEGEDTTDGTESSDGSTGSPPAGTGADGDESSTTADGGSTSGPALDDETTEGCSCRASRSPAPMTMGLWLLLAGHLRRSRSRRSA